MRRRESVEYLAFLTFPIRPLVEDVVFVFGTLFGQGRLLKPFDLVEVLGETVLAVLLVFLPLHLNLTEPKEKEIQNEQNVRRTCSGCRF